MKAQADELLGSEPGNWVVELAGGSEAEVTAQNCGQVIEAQSLELGDGGRLRTQYLTMTAPDCDAIGDFLVLNNLVDDPKIAAN